MKHHTTAINQLPQVSEHIEQTNVIQWFRLQYPRLKHCLFAIPNGGARHIAVAKKLKSEGVMAGVSDLFLMVAKGGHHGLFIEMKAIDGKLSAPQKRFINDAKMQGYSAEVAYGFDEAKNIIQKYLQG